MFTALHIVVVTSKKRKRIVKKRNKKKLNKSVSFIKATKEIKKTAIAQQT